MRETFRQSGSFIFCFYFLQRCRLGNAWLSAIRWYLWNPPTLRAWKIATAKIRSSTDRKNITILLLLIYIYIYIYYCFCSVQKINILCDTFKFPNMRSNFVLISQHKRTHEQPERTQLWLKTLQPLRASGFLLWTSFLFKTVCGTPFLVSLLKHRVTSPANTRVLVPWKPRSYSFAALMCS